MLWPEDVTVVDIKDKIEHMTRGTIRHVNVPLGNAERKVRSLQAAERLVPQTREPGVPKL